jgi:hypothetical protein
LLRGGVQRLGKLLNRGKTFLWPLGQGALNHLLDLCWQVWAHCA